MQLFCCGMTDCVARLRIPRTRPPARPCAYCAGETTGRKCRLDCYPPCWDEGRAYLRMAFMRIPRRGTGTRMFGRDIVGARHATTTTSSSSHMAGDCICSMWACMMMWEEGREGRADRKSDTTACTVAANSSLQAMGREEAFVSGA